MPEDKELLEKNMLVKIDEDDINKLSPTTMGLEATEVKTETLAVSKASMAVGRLFVRAMLAGAFISFGATLFTLTLGDATLPFAVQRLLGGLCFCLGLALVLCCGAELFTGNSLMVMGLASKRIGVKGLIYNWIVVYLGNLAGSLLIVLFIFMSNMAAMNGGGVGDAMVSIAVSKVTPDVCTLFFKGILCNILVCLAVWISFRARTITDTVIGIILPITAFVACGFEHCIANMFFLPMGLAAAAAGFGADAATALTFGEVLANIGIVTLGNIVGGGVFVGLAYWFAYHPAAKQTA